MDDEEIEWLMQELSLTAERAKERGLSPQEFLMGLQAYGKKFMEDYAVTTDAGD